MNINVIREPSVYLIGMSQIIKASAGGDLRKFLDDHTIKGGAEVEHILSKPGPDGWINEDMDLIPEIAGRVCYMSFDKPRPGGNKAYLSNILETKHGSVLEHATFNFILTGISRSLTHELVRHRVGVAYSQLSQRYVDHAPTGPDGAWSFICPHIILNKPRSYGIWLEAMENSIKAYDALCDSIKDESLIGEIVPRKEIMGAARSVLPNSTETKMFFSCNLRALRFILQKRGDPAAEREIRTLVRKIAARLNDYCLNSLYDIVDEDNDAGGQLSLVQQNV